MDIPGKDNYSDKKSFLISLIIWVVVIKIIIFLLDPTVMFFIDDSSRYIDTAISSYIPPDRSFLYGFLIRWLTYFSQSLTTLILFQVLCSATSAVLAGYILNRFLSINMAVARVFAVLCANAPIQLMYERYVLTETISLLFFVIFITTAFCYLQKPRIRTLITVNLSGVILIAFRLSYLPVVLSGAVIVPFLAFFSIPPGRDSDIAEDRWNGKPGIKKRVIVSCLHIVLSCLLTYGLHSAYKIINGRLSDKPPAYQYCDGYHLIASWAPLLEKEDFADPRLEGYNKQYFYIILKDRFQRMNQRWSYYGITNYIHHMDDSRVKTNKIAHDTAMHILYRDPFGIIKLAWQGYMDYWDMKLLKKNLLEDRCIREFPNKLLEILKSNYHIYGEGLRFQKTLTNQYFLNAIPWYMVLFCLPLIIVITIIMDKRRRLLFLIPLSLFALLLMVNSTILVHRNTMRFFHPDEWIVILFLGVLIDRILKKDFVRAAGRNLQGIYKKLIFRISSIVDMQGQSNISSALKVLIRRKN